MSCLPRQHLWGTTGTVKLGHYLHVQIFWSRSNVQIFCSCQGPPNINILEDPWGSTVWNWSIWKLVYLYLVSEFCIGIGRFNHSHLILWYFWIFKSKLAYLDILLNVHFLLTTLTLFSSQSENMFTLSSRSSSDPKRSPHYPTPRVLINLFSLRLRSYYSVFSSLLCLR